MLRKHYDPLIVILVKTITDVAPIWVWPRCTIPFGVIGNTTVFGTVVLGSSPGGGA
jgi:hypothetical protein